MRSVKRLLRGLLKWKDIEAVQEKSGSKNRCSQSLCPCLFSSVQWAECCCSPLHQEDTLYTHSPSVHLNESLPSSVCCLNACLALIFFRTFEVIKMKSLHFLFLHLLSFMIHVLVRCMVQDFFFLTQNETMLYTEKKDYF